MGKAKQEIFTRWTKHCHDYLGSDIYDTNFPSLYGTNISIATFPSKKILTLGEVLKEDVVRGRPLFVCEDPSDNQRVYAFPDSETDTKLSLSCCFEGDCGDWDANSAFFRGGKLVAVVSLANVSEANRHKYQPSRDDLKNCDLVKIYRSEIRRLARTFLSYKGKGDPYEEFRSILKAESPSGQGLHDSYRKNIREILETVPSN